MMFVFSTLFEIKLTEGAARFTSLQFSSIRDILERHRFNNSRNVLSNEESLSSVELFQDKEKPLDTFLVSFGERMITLDFNQSEPKEDFTQHKKVAQEIQDQLTAALKNCTVYRTTPLVRGRKIWQYSDDSDGRISENSYTEVLFEQKSPYQQVSILHCSEFGNTLVLDGLENMAEKYDVYTPNLLGIPQGYDYKDKTALILGGGDGAALNYLRKLHPSMITMVEIDDVVIQACKQHLRGCCGDSLDQYFGEHYEVIVGDCLDYLKLYAEGGRKFDYIISDITDIPIEEKLSPSTSEKSQVMFADVGSCGAEFFHKVFNLCLKTLNEQGTILTHVGAASNLEGLESFKREVNKLDEKLEVHFHEEFIPPFLDAWMFCQMKRANVWS